MYSLVEICRVLRGALHSLTSPFEGPIVAVYSSTHPCTLVCTATLAEMKPEAFWLKNKHYAQNLIVVNIVIFDRKFRG